MMPNMDPRALKSMMSRLGIKSSEIAADKVTIECKDRNIIIDQPQVTLIEAQGTKSYQITGSIREEAKAAEPDMAAEISEEDVRTVAEQAGASEGAARKALQESNGDIAAAIIKLKAGKQE